jgi:hypothetical protein
METKPNINNLSSENLLKEFYDGLLKMHRTFENQVLKECGYSMPTYYRKVKGKSMSNADKNKIIAIKDECLRQLSNFSANWKSVITKENLSS